ncbi:MAG: alpha/beta fold hydrolase [Kiritimatiellae bacterium]|nr:alpha/beta fold hydrolase [Kiritimatiellia bacterium]
MQTSFSLLSGSFHLAATLFTPAHTLRGAALLVLPLAEERKGALPFFVAFARSLETAGFASLLFDFAGTGDSEGDFAHVPEGQFLSDLATAHDWLRMRYPDLPLVLCGLRTGAVLAQRYAAVHPDFRKVVCWSPVAGTDFVNQLLQRRMVNDMVAYGKARASRASLLAALEAGRSVDLDGYVFTGAVYRALKNLVADDPGVPVFTTPATVKYPPFWNTVGHVDLDGLIRETVQNIAGDGDSESSRPPEVSGGFGLSGKTGEIDGARYIWDGPEGTPERGLLFLHGWSGDRTGPHRLFVQFARRTAKNGILCLRVDFIGRGLSDGAASDASIAGMAKTAEACLAELRNALPAGAPIQIAAICSGCKVAITLAAAHPELDRLLLWSPESMGSLRAGATSRRKRWHTLLTYAKKLTSPETWKKLLTGKVNSKLVAKALAQKAEVRSAEEAATEDATLETFRFYRRPIHFFFGGSDPDAKGSSAAYEMFCRKNKIPFSLDWIPNAGHSYYGEAWTRQLLDFSERYLLAASQKAGKEDA